MTFNELWDTTQAEGIAETVIPPYGHYEVRIAETKLGKKDSDGYLVIEYATPDGQYRWSDFKWLTKNGQPHEGRIKSAKILLGSLGYPTVAASELQSTLDSLEGKRFRVEVYDSGQANPVTGENYRNTRVIGPVTTPEPAPEPVAAPWRAAAAPADDPPF